MTEKEVKIELWKNFTPIDNFAITEDFEDSGAFFILDDNRFVMLDSGLVYEVIEYNKVKIIGKMHITENLKQIMQEQDFISPWGMFIFYSKGHLIMEV